MTYALRGRPLELAVKRAAVQYRKEGRACLVQQYPRVANGKDGIIIAGQAPIDFLGAIGDAAGAIECKQCERKSFPLANIDLGQQGALDAFEAYGFDVRLVIDMAAHDEIYVVPWFQVAAFIAAPWRKSLSITWLRAFGQLAPMRGEGERRTVLFLDAVAHPESERSMLEIWHEREAKPLVSLEGEEEEKPEEAKPSPIAGLSTQEVRERIHQAMEQGFLRQARKVKRNWMRTRPRRTQ